MTLANPSDLLEVLLAYRHQHWPWPRPRPTYLPHPCCRLPRVRGVLPCSKLWPALPSP